jgi:hypothetical protein
VKTLSNFHSPVILRGGMWRKKRNKHAVKILSILKVDDDNSLKQFALDGLGLDPLSISPNQSGVTTTPLDGVSVVLIETQIFQVSILNNLRAGNILHLFRWLLRDQDSIPN